MSRLIDKAGSLKKIFGILLVILSLQTAFFAQQRFNTRKNSIGMEFVSIPAGAFLMGLNDTDLAKNSVYDKKKYPKEATLDWYDDEIPQRRVNIKNFWLGRHEVTQAQWHEVMATSPSSFGGCAQCPVDSVNWDLAQDFIKRLNAKNDGFTYRLPTEAEWEYAARAGTTTQFAFGDSLIAEQANFDGAGPYGENAAKGQFLKQTTTVGSYQPNNWGLYDMHGNVYEWVEDIKSDNYLDLPTDGSANLTKGDATMRVLRGGSWKDLGWFCRPFIRWNNEHGASNAEIGFRIVALPTI